VSTIAKSLELALQQHRAGRLEQAEHLYRQILQDDPTCADAWHLLGLLAHQAGRSETAIEHINRAIGLEASNAVFHSSLGLAYRESRQLAKAAASYQEGLKLQPNDIDGHFVLGVVLKELKRFGESAASFRQVLQLEPDSTRAHYQLGCVFQKSGRPAEATSHFQQVLRSQPENAEVHYRLGVVVWEQGKIDEALPHFEQSLQLQPDQPIAYNYLGVGLARRARFGQALTCFRKAIQLWPHYVEAYKNLGAALGEQGEFTPAISNLKRAIELDPNHVDAHYNLGVTFEKLGQLDEAAACYEQALRLQPDYFRAYNNLGLVFSKQGKNEAAERYFQKAIQVNPRYAKAYYHLGSLYRYQEETETARQYFQHASNLEPDHILWRLEIDILCPSIMPDRRPIYAWRKRIETALARYPERSIDLLRWLPEIPGGSNIYPPFEFAYHGENDRPFKEKLARLFTVPQSTSTPASSQITGPYSDNQLHIGFLVTKNHELGLIYFVAGVINHLNPDFKVSIICPAPAVNRIRPAIEKEDAEILVIPENLATAVKKIKAENFDLIYYWEVGTDTFNYFLPFFRLAPVQCTSWGNPTTTGVPQMDYFLSSESYEIKGAETHYSEQLVRLKTLGVYYKKLSTPAPLKPRSYFGLSEEEHIYLCTQNLKKIHPDFDPILGEILRRDEKGKVLLKAKKERLNRDLMARFKRTIPDVLDRIELVLQQSYDDFLNLIAVSNVLLDTVHYSGGTTSFESLSLGTPIVTLPTGFMRGRMTLGCYRKIGVMDCVAESAEEYVEIAVRLGTDRGYREEIKARILAANDALYEDMAAVREMEQFFRWAIEKARADNDNPN
jgi:predicted O-linked N-acetylglucosamine transferase (SPINDLY family)